MFHGIPQNTSFKVEIRNFKQEKHVKPSSSITPMSPFIKFKLKPLVKPEKIKGH